MNRRDWMFATLASLSYFLFPQKLLGLTRKSISKSMTIGDLEVGETAWHTAVNNPCYDHYSLYEFCMCRKSDGDLCMGVATVYSIDNRGHVICGSRYVCARLNKETCHKTRDEAVANLEQQHPGSHKAVEFFRTIPPISPLFITSDHKIRTDIGWFDIEKMAWPYLQN